MFEHSLIDLETKQQPRGRRWLSLPVAVVLHLVAFTTFAFASYWNVGTVADPAINVAFIDVQLPPPPPPASSGHPKPQPTKPAAEPPQPTPVRTVQQPTTVPDKPLDTPPSTDPLPEAPGPVSDPGPSTPGLPGPPGPPGTGRDPGPGIGDGPSAPVHLTAEMTPPVAVYKVQPRYTEVARRAGVQGVVIVEAVVDEQGRVSNVRVLRHLPMGLDQAAIDAIQQWRFTPAAMQGRPVKVYFTLTANFTLQR